MEIIILIGAMVIVGLIMGFIAGMIWKENRPFGVAGDYGIAVITAIAMGLIDYFVVPAMGFSDTIKWIGVATEPAGAALIVLWLIRKVKK